MVMVTYYGPDPWDSAWGPDHGLSWGLGRLPRTGWDMEFREEGYCGLVMYYGDRPPREEN